MGVGALKESGIMPDRLGGGGGVALRAKVGRI